MSKIAMMCHGTETVYGGKDEPQGDDHRLAFSSIFISFSDTCLSSFTDAVMCANKSHSRKEVFQPHLPVRLPCYDLAPITSFALGRSSR